MQLRNKDPQTVKSGEVFPEVPQLTRPIFGNPLDDSDDDWQDEEEENDYTDFPNFILSDLDEDLDDIEEENENDIDDEIYAVGSSDSNQYSSVTSRMTDTSARQASSYAEGPGLVPNVVTEEVLREDKCLWFVIYAKNQDGKVALDSKCKVKMMHSEGSIVEGVNVRSFQEGSFL
eukprot:TRINITY_DN3512_c0_g1_i1.p1 TRINITY_DN3512_c0_g1~~TRINITY_DN3512_c0_g1_i1.p1  ORF type:complete len:175 (-),score=46.60 TRINITY_DN3512_c0_g1_i1:164-688(-)